MLYFQRISNKITNNKQDNKQAEQYYKRAIEANPKDAHNLGNYAVFLHKQNNEQAEQYYKKAIEESPNDANYNMNFGFFYLQRGNLELAEQYLLQSVDLGSLDFGNMNLGHVYFAQGNKQQAFETYTTSIKHFADKNKFFEGFDDDFQHLEQYGITKEDYTNMKNKLLDI